MAAAMSRGILTQRGGGAKGLGGILAQGREGVKGLRQGFGAGDGLLLVAAPGFLTQGRIRRKGVLGD